MTEAGEVLTARINEGAAALVLPVVFALRDAATTQPTYSLDALPSYADNHVSLLKPPTTRIARYSCLSSGDALRDAARGCASGLQTISLGASSVYVPQFHAPTQGGSSRGYNVAAKLASHAASLNASSYLDVVTPPGWKRSTHWLDVWLATTDGAFRQYPGAVGDIGAVDKDGYRTYDPTARPWYQEAVAATTRNGRSTNCDASKGRAALPAAPPLHLTAPYVDAFGRGYLLSLETAVADGACGVAGVAGADLLVKDFSMVIASIKSRESGAAHLYHVGSLAVLASPQLDTAVFEAQEAPPTVRELLLPPENTRRFGDSSTLASCFATCKCSTASSGGAPAPSSSGVSIITDGVVAVFSTVLDGSFCLVTVTPLTEIDAPIEVQIATIRAETSQLFSLLVLIAAIVFAVVFTAVLGVSLQLSAPLAKICAQSRRITQNIGSEDLFEGVTLHRDRATGCCAASAAPSPLSSTSSTRTAHADGTASASPRQAQQHAPPSPWYLGLLCDPIGEVSELRGTFAAMLSELMRRRKQHASVGATTSPNPFYGGAALPAGLPTLPPHLTPIPSSAQGAYAPEEEVMAQQTELLRTQLGVSGSSTEEVVQAACDELGIDRTGLALTEQADACWRKLGSPTLPVAGATSVPPASRAVHEVRVDVPPVAVAVVDDVPPPTIPLTKWNKMTSKIGAKLLLPLAIAMLVFIASTYTIISGDVNSWTAPVKQAMVAEELQTLNTRAYERAQFVAAAMQGYLATLDLVHDNMQSVLFSNALPLRAPYTSYGTPPSRCNELLATYPTSEQQLEVGSGAAAAYARSASIADGRTECAPIASLAPDSDGRHGAKVSVSHEAGTWFAPRTLQPAAYKNNDDGLRLAPNVVLEQQLATHLDNVWRVAYFSADVTYVYAGFHHTEVYRQFPYMSGSWLLGERECDAHKGRRLVDYTPVCRAWYTNAVAAKGEAAFNPVGDDAVNPGSLYLSLSRSILGAAAEVVGVAAIDLSLYRLSEQLIGTAESPRRVYASGYVFVWDASRMGVVHKNYPREHSSSGSAPDGGPVPVARLEANLDETFMENFEVNVLDRGRVEGNWSFEWRDETFDPPVTYWHYRFLPIEGTTYMLAITVEETEVVASAEEMRRSAMSIVTTQTGVSCALFLLLCAILIRVTALFQRRFARPLRRLQAYVAACEKTCYRQRLEADKELAQQHASSYELLELTRNFAKLTTALRFGNARYYGGSKEREVRNALDTLALVSETGNARGIGVVHNNLGLAAMDSKAMAALPFAARNLAPDHHFPLAIENARARHAVAAEEGSAADTVATGDTLAQRTGNFALHHISTGGFGAAGELLRSVGAQKGVSTRVLASIASQATAALGLAAERAQEEGDGLPKAAGRDASTAWAAVDAVCQATIGRARGSSRPAADHSSLAELCAAMADVAEHGGQHEVAAQWAQWGLTHTSNASEAAVCRLILHLKANATRHAPDLPSALDAMLAGGSGHGATALAPRGAVTPGDALGTFARHVSSKPARGPKSVAFLIDRTWTPIVETAINATAMIISEHLSADDRCGLYSLGQQWLIPMQARGHEPQGLLARVRAANATEGSCELYSSMAECLKGLRAEPAERDKWLVVLTDLVDLSEQHNAAASEARARAVILSMENLLPNLSLVVVDSEKISQWEVGHQLWPTWRANVGAMVGRLTGRNATALHIPCDSDEEIRAAFEKVAAMISGMSEAL